MSDLEAIAALFQQVDNSLERSRERHEAAGEADERDHVARRQKLNEQAYFVLAWGQLEADIDDACRDAIRLGKSRKIARGLAAPPGVERVQRGKPQAELQESSDAGSR